MVTMVDLFQHAVELAPKALVFADAKDLGDLVGAETEHAQFTRSLEDLVDREMPPKHKISAQFNLIERIVAPQTDGRPIRLREFGAHDEGPLLQALANDRGAEPTGARLQGPRIRHP